MAAKNIVLKNGCVRKPQLPVIDKYGLIKQAVASPPAERQEMSSETEEDKEEENLPEQNQHNFKEVF